LPEQSHSVSLNENLPECVWGVTAGGDSSTFNRTCATLSVVYGSQTLCKTALMISCTSSMRPFYARWKNEHPRRYFLPHLA
jgi:hypothetical protein